MTAAGDSPPTMTTSALILEFIRIAATSMFGIRSQRIKELAAEIDRRLPVPAPTPPPEGGHKV